MVLQVLGRREHLICKTQESSKGVRFGVTPPAKTRGGAPYGTGRLKGLGCVCEVRASRWHRETINPSAGRRNTAGPSASFLSSGQHSLRCNTQISTISALTRARPYSAVAWKHFGSIYQHPSPAMRRMLMASCRQGRKEVGIGCVVH